MKLSMFAPLACVLSAAMVFTSSCSFGKSQHGSDTLEASFSPVAVTEAHAVIPSPTLPPSPSPLPPSSPPKPTPEPYEGELIADYALQFDGYSYNYGGKDPSTGFDCSGLVFYVYRQFGYRLSRVACDQAGNGTAVDDLNNLLPGDVVCFSWKGNSYINHAGIYLGDGLFLHAMDSEHDVLVTPLSEYLQTHDCHARRIIGSVEKMTVAQIEALEQAEEIMVAQLAEEAAKRETGEDSAQAEYTPPPATIPDPEKHAAEQAAEAHRREIEEAWAEILEDAENAAPAEADSGSGLEQTPQSTPDIVLETCQEYEDLESSEVSEGDPPGIILSAETSPDV